MHQPNWHRVVIFLGLCGLLGCGQISSPEQGTLATLQADGEVKAVSDEQGHVVSLTSRAVSDETVPRLEAFRSLKTVKLAGSPIGDIGLGILVRLPHIEALSLENSQVTDAGLASLHELKQLRELNLAGCQITDAGLEPLSHLTELTMLNLNETQVIGTELSQLTKLRQLESLFLQRTPVTFEQTAPLTGLEKLKILHLAGTNTGRGIERAITGLPSLERLYLNETRIEDADIPALATAIAENCPRFKGLFIEKTSLSDEIIDSLSPLTNLPEFTLLHIQGTQITKAGLARLRKLLPEVNVISHH